MISPHTTNAIRRPAPHAADFNSRGRVTSAHLVGVCGAGMKALAEMLTGLGWKVSGSDLQQTGPAFRTLEQRGLRFHQGHDDRFLPRNADVLIYSPAVDVDNPERRLAGRLNIPQFSYSQMLGRLMQERIGVCIAGTHGKSTTTAMTASILNEAGLAPSAVIGAELCGRMDSNPRHAGRSVDFNPREAAGVSGWAGEGELFVVESCEYQRSFLDLSPRFAVITGIEPDHFDYYRDFAETQAAFGQFAARVADDGVLLVRGDCPASLNAAKSASAEVVTFSCEPGFDWWGTDVRCTDAGLRFRVFHRGEFFTDVLLQVPGRHNELNALAAAALSHYAGASAMAVREALREFRGIRRRFEHVGSWRGVTLIDDYAHHPTAVRATLETAREMFGRRRIWCAFQPHQVSRTQTLMQEFARSFHAADEVLIAPIFAARECPADEPHTVAEELASRIAAEFRTPVAEFPLSVAEFARIRADEPDASSTPDRPNSGESGNSSRHTPCAVRPPSPNSCEFGYERERRRQARFCPSLDQIVATLDDEARPGDVLITMGAGDINRVHHEFTRRLRRHHPPR